MLTSDIRRENARALAAQAGSPAEFGRQTGMSDSQVSQLIGEKPAKNIGSMIARRIETAFGKPEGWMDVLHLEGVDGDERQSEEAQRIGAAFADEIVELITLYKNAPANDRKMIMEAARLQNRRRDRLGIADGSH